MMLKNNVFSSMSFGFFALFVNHLDKIKNGGVDYNCIYPLDRNQLFNFIWRSKNEK